MITAQEMLDAPDLHARLARAEVLVAALKRHIADHGLDVNDDATLIAMQGAISPSPVSEPKPAESHVGRLRPLDVPILQGVRGGKVSHSVSI